MDGAHVSQPDFSSVVARGPEGERAAAIGDIHGRVDLLASVSEKLLKITEASDVPMTIVFLGDYIDRGDDSRAVLNYLSKFKENAGTPTRFLMGNHEFMLLEFLAGRSDGRLWMGNGGQQTLASFGLPPIGVSSTPVELDQKRLALKDALGDCLHFLAGLEMSWRWGDFFFCHAGVDPDCALEEQEAHSLIWGHPKFRSTVRKDQSCVIHGHYADAQVQIDRSHICIDTGAFSTGKLSSLVIEDNDIRILSSAS